TASRDRTVKLWQADTGAELATLNADDSAALAVAFAHDGTLLATAGADGGVRLWDVPARKLLGVLGRHRASVWSVAFSRDDRLLASGSSDSTAKLWDVKERKEVTTIKTVDPGPVTADTSPVKGPPKKETPEPRTESQAAPVAELLEDDADRLAAQLDNNGGHDASVAARDDRTFFSGTCSLAVTPFQRFRLHVPGWRFRVAESPGPGEYRYLRFAWKRS